MHSCEILSLYFHPNISSNFYLIFFFFSFFSSFLTITFWQINRNSVIIFSPLLSCNQEYQSLSSLSSLLITFWQSIEIRSYFFYPLLSCNQECQSFAFLSNLMNSFIMNNLFWHWILISELSVVLHYFYTWRKCNHGLWS